MSAASPLPEGLAELALPLERLVSPKSAGPLKKHLGLGTVGELLNHFPRRYL